MATTAQTPAIDRAEILALTDELCEKNASIRRLRRVAFSGTERRHHLRAGDVQPLMRRALKDLPMRRTSERHVTISPAREGGDAEHQFVRLERGVL